MLSKVERFWIAFNLRFAFGFLFLIASLNIFHYGPEKFATDLSKPYEGTWLWTIQGDQTFVQVFIEKFLFAMPFIMGALSVPILTGIFAKPALRIASFFLICLGLGKYIQNDIATTAADFTLALIIWLGLFTLGREDREETGDYAA